MKTALTQAIETEISIQADLLPKLNSEVFNTPEIQAEYNTRLGTILRLKALIPIEKEQMNRAYRVAEGDSKFDTKTRFDKGLLFEDYYKETYNE